jgi:hypothetical protein
VAIVSLERLAELPAPPELVSDVMQRKRRSRAQHQAETRKTITAPTSGLACPSSVSAG